MNEKCRTKVFIELSVCEFGALDLKHWQSHIDEIEERIKSAPSEYARQIWQSRKNRQLLQLSEAIKRNIAPSSLQKIYFKGDSPC